MHLVHGHQHAIRAGVLEVEVVAGRAQDRLVAQAQVLRDAVHRVHDVIAHLEVGERDRHALFDGAQLDALGGLAENLAVAEHVQVQHRDREAALDRSLIDVHGAARGPGGGRRDRDTIGTDRARAQMHERRVRSTLTFAPRRISARRDAPFATSQTVSPAATHSRTACVNIAMRRLKCSAGRVSSTNDSIVRGSQASSPASMPPLTTSTRRERSRSA